MSSSPPAAPRADQPHRFPCQQCGATLQYAPGTQVLKCAYCGFENRIASAPVSEPIREQDFRDTLARLATATPRQDHITNHCDSCGATFTFTAAVHAGDCPFCGAPVVSTTQSHRELPVQALLPFSITTEQAREAFRRWLKRLWFAPNALQQYARDLARLSGLYVPYWTYDAATTTDYSGERGDYYQVEERYIAIENGREVQRTRQVTKIRWTPAAGRVWRDFDDVLVLASGSLPRAITERLEPWDLANLEPYREEFLSGFRSEMYQVNLDQGFERARELMAVTIRNDIARDIGGDQQRIHRLDTRYGDIRFKHILLPIWMSAFRFRNKVYRFVVNGRTGKVQGERPYSPWKIALAVVLGLALTSGGALLWQKLHTQSAGSHYPVPQFQYHYR